MEKIVKIYSSNLSSTDNLIKELERRNIENLNLIYSLKKTLVRESQEKQKINILKTQKNKKTKIIKRKTKKQVSDNKDAQISIATDDNNINTDELIINNTEENKL